jgi:integrase
VAERKRRQYGTGSVYQRTSDGRWFGAIQAGYLPSGGRRTITVSAADEATAKRRLRDKQRELERDGLPEVGGGRVTVKAWADVWLAGRVARLRPNAFTATRSAVTTWIVPTIGHKPLATLTPGDVRAVATAMRKAGRKPSSALRTHTVLVSMLKAALVEGHPVPPRVLLVERPGLNANDRLAIPTPDAAQLLATAVELGLPHVSRWMAALLQGMRQGECLGLTRAADLGDALDVSWQLQALPYLDRKDRSRGFRVPDDYEARQLVGRHHLVRPKTARGRRVIPVVPWFREALDQWYEVAPASPHDLVWPAVDGGPASVKDDLEEWKALQATAGIGHPAGRPYVLHEARHTTATILLELGVDRAVIEQIVGQAKLLDTYLHAPAHMAADALASVAERLQLAR